MKATWGGLRADVLSAEKMSSPETQNWSSNICILILNKLVLQVDSEGHHSFFLSLLSRRRLKRFGCLYAANPVFKIRPCVSAAEFVAHRILNSIAKTNTKSTKANARL